MKKRYLIAALALVAIPIIFFYFDASRSGDGGGESANGRASALKSTTDQASATASTSSETASQPRPLLPLPRLFEEARQQTENKREPWSADSDEGSLDGSIQRMLERNPELAKFYELRRKALRSSAEQQQYLDMMASPEILAGAKDNLLAALHGTEITQEGEMERVMHVRYLSSALTWEDNPQRDQVIASINEVLLAELPSGLPSDLRGSVLGDKVELYQYLLLTNPDIADEIMARAKNTKLENVLLAARRMIQPADEAVPTNGQL